MKKTSSATSKTQPFSEQLCDYMRAQLKADEAGEVCDFAREYFARLQLEGWENYRLSDIYACTYGLWNFIQVHNPRHPKVRVFNPSLEQDGWLCEHTVVTVLHEDAPFLVDSIRIEINRRGIPITSLRSTIFTVTRDQHHHCRALLPQCPIEQDDKKSHCRNEALVYLEISLQSSERKLTELTTAIRSVLADVRAVVSDYHPMRDHALALADGLHAVEKKNAVKHIDETEDFLRWLTQNHFTFLGCATYKLTQRSGKPVLKELPEQRLGLLNLHSDIMEQALDERRNPGVLAFCESAATMCFSKSPVHSRVHRKVYPDYLLIKRYNKQGKAVGIDIFLGLYTFRVYNLNPAEIPYVSEKIQQVIRRSGVIPDSYNGKVLRQVINVFPKEELFQSSVPELHENTLAVTRIYEQNLVRIIMRPDHLGRFINCILYVPRDIFNTTFRVQVQELIADAVGTNEHEYAIFLSESTHARIYIIFRIDPDNPKTYDVKQLEAKIADIARSWQDHLLSSLIDTWGEEKGGELYRRYHNAFPLSYQENFDARLAVNDINTMAELESDDDIAMNFYQPIGFEASTMRFKVFRLSHRLELSDVVPVLEHLGLRVRGAHPYKICRCPATTIWLLDFDLKFGLPVTIDVQAARTYFQEAFAAIWREQAESDAFNRLVLGARLNWREVAVLRAYCAYMKQTRFNFSQTYIANTLSNHLEITRNLVAIFKIRFDPRFGSENSDYKKRIKRLKDKIIEGLDKVDNLNEDHIIRRYLALISNTMRTNFFQTDSDGDAKPVFALKLHPKKIPDIPQPHPEYEIFIYSPRVEGVHLRGGKVARGGIRWSKRLEDYRTEILGLVKAQQVKNAVIVPSGAKGGFIAKQTPASSDRKALIEEGVACYQLFIQGLLDVTDNLVDGKIVAPPMVVRRDGDDPYLVVAADTGTATFSDIANDIAKRGDFWLGDAFASGGSQGYDHKKMGITARGAWVSVQRHFREYGINVQTENFTVIGIGDMAGDVFGNGMLMSEHICLVAAFNHQHIFVDPTPDVKASFKERQRLFALTRSSWADYDKDLLSKGGGIFSRDAKSIAISSEMRKVFHITAKRLTPEALLHALLKAPVDLIWNGGIGTYVKASHESQASAGDKANDTVRVNGNELHCRVFAEGGNLGMTQAGRVEYCLNKGKCNTDFIDNAAGVDCSDHEVNIKILLGKVVTHGDMTEKQRNTLLEKMTDDVADLVLKNNYRQTQALSIAEYQSGARMGEYRRFIDTLEEQGRLKRKLEHLPDDETLLERQAQNKSLTRPELSVLLSYAKIQLKEELIIADVAANDYMANAIVTAFPKAMHSRFAQDIARHRLRKEIVATQIANDLVNNMGITFYTRLLESTTAEPKQIAHAYAIARDVYDIESFLHDIAELDYKITAKLQLQLISTMMQRVRQGTRWLLRNRLENLPDKKEVTHFRSTIKKLMTTIPKILHGSFQEEWQAKHDDLLAKHVPSPLIIRCIGLPAVYSGLGIIDAIKQTGSSIKEVATVYFFLGDKLNLLWLANQGAQVAVESTWQATARQSFLDDLGLHTCTLAVNLIKNCDNLSNIESYLEQWLEQQTHLLSRWRTLINGLQSALTTDFAMLSVSMRELSNLAAASGMQKAED